MLESNVKKLIQGYIIFAICPKLFAKGLTLINFSHSFENFWIVVCDFDLCSYQVFIPKETFFNRGLYKFQDVNSELVLFFCYCFITFSVFIDPLRLLFILFAVDNFQLLDILQHVEKSSQGSELHIIFGNLKQQINPIYVEILSIFGPYEKSFDDCDGRNIGDFFLLLDFDIVVCYSLFLLSFLESSNTIAGPWQ